MDIKGFETWIFNKFKIDLSAYKPVQLHRRIGSLMNRVGAGSYQEYTRLLEKDEGQRQKFLDYITINVTEFFRNPELFSELKEKINEKLLKEKRSLRIWSAACSSGAEPYSISILLQELSSINYHEIIATDIDNTILNKARRGEYTLDELKNISSDTIKKYFYQEGDKYFVSPKIKNSINFRQHDLILDDFFRDLDLIVCRNVVIYFNSNVKNDIYKKFYRALRPGGLLFVGATESIYNYKELGFEKAATFIYRKI